MEALKHIDLLDCGPEGLEHKTVGLADLSRSSGMSEADLAELVDYGGVVSLAPHGDPHRFNAACVAPLRAAQALRLDFDLDLFTVAVLIGCLTRIDALESRVSSLQAQLQSMARGQALIKRVQSSTSDVRPPPRTPHPPPP